MISAVGHEIDVTLSDLAADVRALTPSEAAELVAPAAEELAAQLRQIQQRLAAALRGRAESARARLDAAARHAVFRRPYQRIFELARRLDELDARALRAVRGRMRFARQQHRHRGRTAGVAQPVGGAGAGIQLDAAHGRRSNHSCRGGTFARRADHHPFRPRPGDQPRRPGAMSMFQDLTDVYEAMIDWPKRLAHEEPFYRRLFAEHGVRSVVDTACGTGRHAAMFHSWGLRVEGADVSPGMIDRARANFGEPARLRWVVRGFDEPIAPAEPFDAAVCVGNSLPLAPDIATAERAIGQMLAAVRRGGLLVVQALNLWRLPDGPCIWQKCRLATLNEGESPHHQGRSSLGRARLRGTDRGRSRQRRLAANGIRAVHGAGSRRVGVDGPGCRGERSTLLRRLSRRALRPSGERGLADGGDKVFLAGKAEQANDGVGFGQVLSAVLAIGPAAVPKLIAY